MGFRTGGVVRPPGASGGGEAIRAAPDLASEREGCRYLGRRATPTFDGVPTGHLFFPYIEAVAAFGITAGCGGGTDYSDSPLTRGQMAVILEKGWACTGVPREGRSEESGVRRGGGETRDEQPRHSFSYAPGRGSRVAGPWGLSTLTWRLATVLTARGTTTA